MSRFTSDSRKGKDFFCSLTHVMHDSLLMRKKPLLVTNGVSAQQKFIIWSVDNYVPSLYSANITECGVKP